MENKPIIVTNAKTHNLKSVSLEIPRDKLVIFTGISGSGKSSLVFDTIYTEAQRQLIETFSSFARARMPKLSKPPVEEIKNISTAIVIDQKRMGKNMRSTVGTATELNTYLRLLYSRCGDKFIGPSFMFGFNHPEGMCLNCKGLGKEIRINIDKLIDKDKNIREGAITHPDYRVGNWFWRELGAINLFDIDKKLKDFTKEELDNLLYAEAIPVEKQHGVTTYTKNFEGIARKLERLYLNKPVDQMNESRKSVYEKYFIHTNCSGCGGTRLNELARSVKIEDKNITQICDMELTEVYSFLEKINNPLSKPIIKKMKQILSHLIGIGVGYLSLSRNVSTLSGGESQRVKMARQLDCDLVEMMYILDEPSVGLHPRDTNKLMEILMKLKEKGNSVFVVEHDPYIMSCADFIVDVGPKAGKLGGEIIYAGDFEGLKKSNGLTAKYLNNIDFEKSKKRTSNEFIEIKNANLHNLKNVSTKIPRGVLTCVTGVAGSGKSSLINEKFVKENNEVIVIDQSGIGKSSRSNPVTYVGVFDLMRAEIGKATEKSPALFSFNSVGACPKCNGQGMISVEMNFLDDVKITCSECHGKRYTDEVLEIKYKEKNIADILNMTVVEAKEFFDSKEIKRKLNVLCDVGLEYLELGQPLSTLSGGECQRIKLASELHKKGNIYVMDEPTTGLHMADIHKLLTIIHNLVDKGNTVVVIEHNLEMIRNADWVIDLGPEGGKNGGEILFEGTPEDLINCKNSWTGKYLKSQ